MLCAQLLKRKKAIFSPALYFQKKMFLNLQFSQQYAVWVKNNGMDG
jgi:hypothetical protein